MAFFFAFFFSNRVVSNYCEAGDFKPYLTANVRVMIYFPLVYIHTES